GLSSNRDAGVGGDACASSGQMDVNPIPPEILARIGNVNDAPGDPVPVFFVNGSRGDDRRVVTVPTGASPMALSIGTYPGAPPSIPYVFYALRRENRAADVTKLPHGIGPFCFSTPLTGGAPVVVANTLGHESVVGVPRVRGTPLGPGDFLAVPKIPAKVSGL